MKRIRATQFLVLVLVAIVLSACEPASTAPKPEALVAPTMKLTSAVQAVLLYPENGIPVADDQLYAAAVKDKPELQAAFQGVVVKIKHDSRNVVILVCSPDGKVAWLEDASWTVPLDKKWYEIEPSHPAAFTLDFPPARGKTAAATSE